jgi:hypothetical protein
MILIIAILVRPMVTLVYVVSFRRVIANVLKSADEVEIGPHGLKWRKTSRQGRTTVNRV